MLYTISKDCWHQCQICKITIQELAKIYGGGNIYYTQVFRKHLEIDHHITDLEYFTQYVKRPICKCNVCQKPCVLKKQNGSNFYWRKWMCGRTPGTIKWSKRAKSTRCGSGNPMYNKNPWNKGLTKENSDSIKIVSDKMSGRKFTTSHKKKLSKAAKNRKIHGHSGKPHSEKTKEIIREKTLQNIKAGKFKQTKTKPHIVMSSVLDSMKLNYEEEKIVDVWSFDFYLKDYDTYIEVDGDYFHSNPKIYPDGPKTKTQKRNFYLHNKKNEFCQKNNLKLLRFWESDILNNNTDVKRIIKCTLNV